MLRLDAVTKRYGSLTALNGISLNIARGECFGLLGPNGAGKSTLMSLLAGLRTPDAGTLTLDGAPLSASDLEALLRRQAEMRWRQKIHFARLRVERLGWDAACHQAALEILGFRFNRAPMLRIAARWPLAEWAAGAVSPDQALAAEAEAWSVQGVRPANHPRVRLAQYAAWVRAVPDWPVRLREFVRRLPADEIVGGSTREVRRKHDFSALRADFAREICGEAVGGTRLDNLICDGLIPLLATREARGVVGLWHHWFPGDLPPVITRGLRELACFDGRSRPACHGVAQGLLGWLIEREGRPAP